MEEQQMNESLMLNTEQLISLLKKKIDDMKTSDHIIGKLILQMKDKDIHKDSGFNSFSKFLKSKFSLTSRTANRYIHKYLLIGAFPEYKDGIQVTSANICDIVYMAYTFSDKSHIEVIVSKMPHVTVKEANALYVEVAKIKKEIRANRVVVQLSDVEMAEVEDAEETIMQAFELTSRKDVFVNAIRSLKTEADVLLANQ